MSTQAKPKSAAEIITPEVVEAVRVWLLAKAHAQAVHAEVDEVQRQVLRELNSPPDPANVRRGADASPILDPSRDYLLPETVWQRYHATYQERIRRGGKWADVPDEHCPALVAEELERQAQRVVIDLTAPKFGLDAHQLLCAGLETYNKWADIHAEMAVKSPLWSDPLELVGAK